MKVTSGVLGSRSGAGLLWTAVLVSLALGIALTLLLIPGSATADGQDEFTAPIVLEEIRTPPKVVEPPSVRDVPSIRQVQGSGASITQTSSTLISNKVGGNPSGTTLNTDQAQSFTTGSNSFGYRVTSVEMEVNPVTSQSDYSVSIRANSSTGRPDTTLGTLTKSGSLSPLNTFTFVSFPASGDGIDLDANSTYWLVARANSSVAMRYTGVNLVDTGGAPGWIMGIRRVNPNWQESNTGNLRFAVVGYAKVPPDLTSAEVNGTSLVLTFDQHLDTASRTAARQFGIRFGGGALRSVTAISISGRQVTLTVPEVRAGQVVTVSYTKPTSNPLKGSNGLEVDAISDYTVTVNTAPAYGRLPESGKVRDAVYVTYTNAAGEEVAVENRAASADRETLWDFFYDSCQSQRSVTTVHDYSQSTEIVTPSGTTRTVTTQARNGWKWVWVQDANGAVTGTRAQTLNECANHGMYLRQQNCANEDWLRRNPHLHEGTCPTDRTW